MPIVAEASDVDFERRWKARGLAHERAVRHRFVVSAITALLALIAYVAFSV